VFLVRNLWLLKRLGLRWLLEITVSCLCVGMNFECFSSKHVFNCQRYCTYYLVFTIVLICRLVTRRSRVQVVESASRKICRERLHTETPSGSDPSPCKVGASCPRLPLFTIVLIYFKCPDHSEFAIHPNMTASADVVMAFSQ
jgi:hypothetical protein